MTNILSERIAELRRERGLTQEQLGQLVGVSAQAVSKWEKGGAPDVELLPALADRLGVTIDSLFGREGGATADIPALARRWMAEVPEGQQIGRLCQLSWALAKEMTTLDISMPDISCMDRCEYSGHGEEKTLVRSCVSLKDGILLGVEAKDLSFMTIWPKPEAGWSAYLSGNDTYRALFSCLARPYCLELLEYLYSVEQRYYVPGVAAERSGCPLEDTERNMALLAELGLLLKLELELETGNVNAYQVHDNAAFVPFLYLARCLATKSDSFLMMWQVGTHPPLRGPGKSKETEKP